MWRPGQQPELFVITEQCLPTAVRKYRCHKEVHLVCNNVSQQNIPLPPPSYYGASWCHLFPQVNDTHVPGCPHDIKETMVVRPATLFHSMVKLWCSPAYCRCFRQWTRLSISTSIGLWLGNKLCGNHHFQNYHFQHLKLQASLLSTCINDQLLENSMTQSSQQVSFNLKGQFMNFNDQYRIWL